MQLLLFLPWRSEDELLQLQSFQEYNDIHIDEIMGIRENKNEFEHHADIINTAMGTLKQMGRHNMHLMSWTLTYNRKKEP